MSRTLPVSLLCLCASMVSAQAPLSTAFTYQGELGSGSGLAIGLHDFRFRLYDAAVGGAQVGPLLCSNNVSLANGRFTVDMDFGAVFAGLQRFLEIDVRADTGLGCGDGTGYTTLAPRQPLTAAPYALFALSIPNPLTLSGTSATHIIRGVNVSEANNSAGVIAEGGWNGLLATGTGFDGFGVEAWGNACGVSGQSSQTGVYGSGETGVHGMGSGVGVYGSSSFIGGDFQGGSRGVRSTTTSETGTGVHGISNSFSGVNYGGLFESRSPVGEGVRGVNISTTGGAIGGTFLSASVDARALYGLATASSGTTYGVVGQSNSSTGGYGVWGTSFPNGWAVYAAGHLGASGTKAFRIDHPFDPENKYLLHYSTEMPEPQNAYNGVIVTDARGEAWVQLPDYFGEINKDFKYQLTVVDDMDGDWFVIAKVAKKIRENRFQIRTSAPNVEVSWEVKAVRNDRWVQQHGAPVEVQKQNAERGTYQHPDLYGQPPEKGMNYDATRQRPDPALPKPIAATPR